MNISNAIGFLTALLLLVSVGKIIHTRTIAPQSKQRLTSPLKESAKLEEVTYSAESSQERPDNTTEHANTQEQPLPDSPQALLMHASIPPFVYRIDDQNRAILHDYYADDPIIVLPRELDGHPVAPLISDCAFPTPSSNLKTIICTQKTRFDRFVFESTSSLEDVIGEADLCAFSQSELHVHETESFVDYRYFFGHGDDIDDIPITTLIHKSISKESAAVLPKYPYPVIYRSDVLSNNPDDAYSKSDWIPYSVNVFCKHMGVTCKEWKEESWEEHSSGGQIVIELDTHPYTKVVPIPLIGSAGNEWSVSDSKIKYSRRWGSYSLEGGLSSELNVKSPSCLVLQCPIVVQHGANRQRLIKQLVVLDDAVFNEHDNQWVDTVFYVREGSHAHRYAASHGVKHYLI